MKRLSFLVAAAFMMGLAACGTQNDTGAPNPDASAEKVKEEAKEAVQEITAFASLKKAQYAGEIEKRLEDVGRRLQELEAKVERGGSEAKAEIHRMISQVQEKKKTAQDKLEELEEASAEAWVDLQDGMEAALADLERSYNQASAHLK